MLKYYNLLITKYLRSTAMSDYKIGRVISVSDDNITNGLLETGKASGQAHTGVPEDMVIRVPAGSGLAVS